ncbi:MAG: Fur family transcriptional regulator [Saccharofermentanales bacterium]
MADCIKYTCCNNVYKTAGLRHTKQRHDLMNLLRTSGVPLSAQEIFSKLVGSGSRLNLSTVYRTLDTLESYRIIRKIVIESENMALYEYNETGHRHYLICLGCKKIRSIEECPLGSYEITLSKETDFVIEGHSLNIYGYCPECVHKNRVM